MSETFVFYEYSFQTTNRKTFNLLNVKSSHFSLYCLLKPRPGYSNTVYLRSEIEKVGFEETLRNGLPLSCHAIPEQTENGE